VHAVLKYCSCCGCCLGRVVFLFMPGTLRPLCFNKSINKMLFLYFGPAQVKKRIVKDVMDALEGCARSLKN
jgi:hypothetical protein